MPSQLWPAFLQLDTRPMAGSKLFLHASSSCVYSGCDVECEWLYAVVMFITTIVVCVSAGGAEFLLPQAHLCGSAESPAVHRSLAPHRHHICAFHSVSCPQFTKQSCVYERKFPISHFIHHEHEGIFSQWSIPWRVWSVLKDPFMLHQHRLKINCLCVLS